jgi:hypothetical protein
MNITQDELVMIIREELEAVLDEKKGSKRLRKKKAKKKAKKKLDRCARIAKRKYKVWPSAYASGAAVKCRKGKIWKGLKEAMDEENFQPHDMYNPETGEEKRAMTYDEHIQLTSQGFTHIDPEELIDTLEVEGGAAGLNAFDGEENAFDEEEEVEKALAGMPNVRKHKHGDYILTDEEGKVLDESINEEQIDEAEYQGRKVPLNKRMRGDVKKFKVYVKGCAKDKDKVTKINFGDKNMKIKKSNPKRRKSFRARHKCKTADDKCTPRYWSCKAW